MIAVIAVIADARLGRALPMATNSPPSVPCGDPTADRSPLPDVVTRIGEGGKVGKRGWKGGKCGRWESASLIIFSQFTCYILDVMLAVASFATFSVRWRELLEAIQ